MEIAKRFVVLIVVLLMAAGAQSAEGPAKISNTRTASCLVKITSDPAVLPLSFETIDYLLRSSGVGGKAVREVLDVSPDQAGDFFTINYMGLLTSDDSARPSPSQIAPSMSELPGLNEDYAQLQLDETMAELGSLYAPAAPGTPPSPRPTRPPPTSMVRPRSSQTRATEPTTRQIVTAAPSAPPAEQTYLFNLNVHLPEEVKPLAKEFMKALLDNLRKNLYEAHQAYLNDLKALLQDAESRRDQTQSRLAEIMEHVKGVGPPPEIKQNPADANVYERLEQIVDLPNLTQGTTFAEVIRQIANAVQPPLQIQPNWKDLLELGEVEPTTPSGMDPLIGVKLRKALDVLLASVSSDSVKLKYVVDEGVILIATADSLPDKMVPCVYEIPALAYSPGSAKGLVETIQNTIDPESWFEHSESGEGTITPYPRQQPKELVILQTYENHQKIWELLRTITIDIPVGTQSEIPVEMLFSQKNNLLREKQNLEMELARLEGRMPAVEAQIRRIRNEIDEKIQADQVSEELRKILDLQIKHLEGIKKLAESGRAQDGAVADIEEKVARAKIELARRREQIGASAGTDQLAKLSNELAMLTIDIAEKKAVLEVIKNQIEQTEQQLTVADISDPQVSRIRLATQALEIAEGRVNEANARLVNLRLPTVSVLGGN